MERQFQSVHGNSQRLDGGAMFGNAPKALWSRWLEPDSENRIELACRCLFVRETSADGPSRQLLLETGVGAFFDPDLKARFGIVEERHRLLDSLAAIGVEPGAIDVVVLSHLHFDHAGGALNAWVDGAAPTLAFENASYVVGREAWQRATKPHPRDRASFIPALQPLLEATGRLEIVDGSHSRTLGDDWRLHVSHGHTPGMTLAEVATDDGPMVFAADLIPGIAWVRRAITMGYDRYPELLIDEKTALLDDLVARNGRLFFTHDPDYAVCGLGRDDRGRVIPIDPVLELTGVAS